MVCVDDGGGDCTEEPAAWVKVNETPAMVEAAVLDEAAVLAAIEQFTVPLPVPLLPEVIVIQDAPLVAVHEHPLCVVTLMLPVVAPAPTDALVGDIE